MYKKNFFLLSFFSFILFITIVKLYDNSVSRDAWQYGEWLINYQAGFVRRGLFGEIIYLISPAFNHNLEFSFLLTISILVLAYYIISFLFIRKIDLNFIFFIIFFSPLFYLFFIVISKVGVKKEIIFYIFYLIYLINLSSRNFTLNKNWIFILLSPALLLIHEGIFFYLPYLILPLFFVIKKENIKLLIFQSLSLILISLIFEIFLYFTKTTQTQIIEICMSLSIYAPVKCDWWGPIAALNDNLPLLNAVDPEGNITKENSFFYIFNEFETYIGFLFYILYSFIPILIFYKFASFKNENLLINKKIFFYIILLLFFYSLPLFHVAQDWSRWFSIHFHLIAFNLLFLQRINVLTFEKDEKFNKINNYLINYNFKKYFITFLIIYATFFHHHHFFFKGVQLEFTYYKVYKKIKRDF